MGQPLPHLPQPKELHPSDALCRRTLPRAVDSHCPRFSKGCAKVTTQLTRPSCTGSVCLIAKDEGQLGSSPRTSALIPRSWSTSQRWGDGRDQDNNDDVSISSALGVFNSSHLTNEPIPAVCA